MTEKKFYSLERKDIIEYTASRLQPLIEEYYLTGGVKGEMTFRRKNKSNFPDEFRAPEFLYIAMKKLHLASEL